MTRMLGVITSDFSECILSAYENDTLIFTHSLGLTFVL